jgi:hypothetical protein
VKVLFMGYHFIPVLLALHGLAHMAELVGAFRLTLPRTQRRASLADSTRARGARLIDLAWLLCAVGFVAAAMGATWSAGWWPAVTLASATVSLLLSLALWPNSGLGLPINLLILGIMLFDRWSGWLLGNY